MGAVGQKSHLHPVHCGVLHVHNVGDDGLHFVGGDVLALPAEGVAAAVPEVKPAHLVHHHDVAGAEVSIPDARHVFQHLVLGGRDVLVSSELPHRMVLDDFAHQLAWFTCEGQT